VKPRLAISFSGGRSSAMMLWLCLQKYRDTHDILITFANTGCEHEETLRFVDAVDRHFADGKVVWIEAVIGGKGVGPRAKVVDYKTASRNGEPFEAAIQKHGVFNASMPNCTGRLKVEPMRAYLRDVADWDRQSYDTAIGIRADEIDGEASLQARDRLLYPLIDAGITKADVKRFMSQFNWDLNLPGEHYGNCVWCWKKSLRKLATVAKHTPEAV
jgi:3'-phosphoadenosine 5'-phosphosulfate sulfotransferase (PAPS reductase)/FAD synthetase